MAKTKSRKELKEALGSAKEEYTVAKNELRTFEKENSLAKGEDHSGSKVGKKWKGMNEMVQKKSKAKEEAQAAYDAAPKEAKAARAVKYTYPADCTSATDKKKFRAAARTKAKKDAKGGDAKATTKGATDTTEVVKKKKKKVKEVAED